MRFKRCLYREITCVQMLAYNVCATSASDGEVILWGAFTLCVCVCVCVKQWCIIFATWTIKILGGLELHDSSISSIWRQSKPY